MVRKESQHQSHTLKTPPTEYLVPSLGPGFLPSPFDTPMFEMAHLGYIPPSHGMNAFVGQSLVNDNAHHDAYQFDLTGLNPLISSSNDGGPYAAAFTFGPVGYVPVEEGQKHIDTKNKPTLFKAISPKAQGQTGYSNLVVSKGSDIEKHNAWPGFACNPPSGDIAIPRVANACIADLQASFHSNDAWAAEIKSARSSPKSAVCAEQVVVQRFTSRARDRLLVITQNSQFLSLPPPEVLEDLLSTYASRFEPHYELVSSTVLDPDGMLDSGSQEASSVLLLLMIAHGASVGRPEARHLGDALTESCRIIFRDLTGTGTRGFDDIEMFRVALATVGLTAWSGYAWHINVCFPVPTYFTLSHGAMLIFPLDCFAPMGIVHQLVHGLWPLIFKRV